MGLDLSKATKVGEYNLLLVTGQILMYHGEELVKAFDIKNINNDTEEFNAFVIKVTKALEDRKK